MDEVLTCGNNSRIAAFKAQFGMENVTHLDDVASTMRYPIWTWLDPPSTSAFQGFCDALEVEDGVNAPERGWGLKHALLAWGKFMPGYLADCESRSLWFFGDVRFSMCDGFLVTVTFRLPESD